MKQPTIGFIGLGMMGRGMARNLLRKGYGLKFQAHRRRDGLEDLLALGAQEVVSRQALAHEADAVILCVTGTPQVESIAEGPGGLIEAAQPGMVVIDTSTSEPASTARLRAAFAQRGATLVDAPLARTPKEAEEGRLNTMVGALPEEFDKVHPILAAFCENVIHVGPPGHGHVLKLINNMLAMTTAAAVAEALATAAKCGLSLQKLYDVIAAGGVNSGIFRMMVGPMLEGQLDGLKFAIANGQKDLRYYAHLAEELPVATPLANAAYQAFVQAANLGLGEKFIPSLLQAQEQLNRVDIVPR
jgi:3-hydroxyisobutyrate dehydrogenase-like beta-hydroxyacid dehydrogenase